MSPLFLEGIMSLRTPSKLQLVLLRTSTCYLAGRIHGDVNGLWCILVLPRCIDNSPSVEVEVTNDPKIAAEKNLLLVVNKLCADAYRKIVSKPNLQKVLSFLQNASIERVSTDVAVEDFVRWYVFEINRIVPSDLELVLTGKRSRGEITPNEPCEKKKVSTAPTKLKKSPKRDEHRAVCRNVRTKTKNAPHQLKDVYHSMFLEPVEGLHVLLAACMTAHTAQMVPIGRSLGLELLSVACASVCD